MNMVAARGVDRSIFAVRWRPVQLALALGLSLWATQGLASDDVTSTIVLSQANSPAMEDALRSRIEVSATTLPRFDNTDGATRSSRLDMTWMPQRRSGLGVSVGMSQLNGLNAATGAPLATAAPGVNLGLHWRYTLDSQHRFDVSAWRRVAPPDALTLISMREPTYGARVEMRIGPVVRQAGFVADRGFIGFQLESGARISLRRSGGQPMLYYRSKF